MFITRFSVQTPEGLTLPKDMQPDDRESLMLFLARSGVAPVVMAPDTLVDLGRYTPGTKNSYLVETGPAAGPNGEPATAKLHILPRSDNTMNIEIGGEHLKEGKMDQPEGEGRTYQIPAEVGGFPLVQAGEDGLHVFELVTPLPLEHVEV